MQDKNIDNGTVFDWGRTSEDYARYRDIYPDEFYNHILTLGLCKDGQKVLDLGTGTGVLPRNLYTHGADFTGIDISENQIKQAEALAKACHMNIRFACMPAEALPFPNDNFDVITACQCFFYFDHAVLAPQIHRLLTSDGSLVVMYMGWLPSEDKIAGKSEALVLKHNPAWTGYGDYRHPNFIPDIYQKLFTIEQEEVFDLQIPFTRDSWNGRIKACRGIGASLSDTEILKFEKEHMTLLSHIAPEQFHILHYAAITVLRKKTKTP
ncbi:MAG: class I SAM-dependent methyltransferase [Bacteroides sp.]|nr:class I SAM-dependent methyltransferase [Bacteroides sp.]MCM1550359.1 class I SAM-dependent methyltransferase [Clostridium sp.]